VPQQDLVDSYLPSFQACVEEGKVSGVMCSYNAVNGVPSCASDWLLKTLLRGAWEFDGYVTSDCDADSDVFFSHHYTNTTSEAVAAILRAGTDVDCGGFMGKYAPAALADGSITDADIDTVLRRLFKVRIRLAQFDPPGALAKIGLDQVCSPYARELARDGVRQSAVLLKNTGGALPLDASKFATAVVIGPNTNLTDTVNYYGGEPCDHARWTAVDAFAAFVGATTYVKGVPDVGSNDTSGVAAAAAAAAAADLVILAIGSDLSLEREGHDRTLIGFSGGQLALIAAVAAAAKGPVVALVFGGGATDISPLLSNAKVTAVLWVGQPSVQVLGAADVVFGKTPDGRAVAPAGRMSQMIYPADYVSRCARAARAAPLHALPATSNGPLNTPLPPPTLNEFCRSIRCRSSTSGCAPGRRRGPRARTRAALTASTRAYPLSRTASDFPTRRGSTRRWPARRRRPLRRSTRPRARTPRRASLGTSPRRSRPSRPTTTST
jgi:pre-mRNA-splicing factor SYF2/beta-D-xylosidase 4